MSREFFLSMTKMSFRKRSLQLFFTGIYFGCFCFCHGIFLAGHLLYFPGITLVFGGFFLGKISFGKPSFIFSVKTFLPGTLFSHEKQFFLGTFFNFFSGFFAAFFPLKKTFGKPSLTIFQGTKSGFCFLREKMSLGKPSLKFVFRRFFPRKKFFYTGADLFFFSYF